MTEPKITIIPEASPTAARTETEPSIQGTIMPPIMLAIILAVIPVPTCIPSIPPIIIPGKPSANMDMPTEPRRMKTPATRLRMKAATGFIGSLILFSLLMTRTLFESVVHQWEFASRVGDQASWLFLSAQPQSLGHVLCLCFHLGLSLRCDLSPVLVFLRVL